ncbi:hypothetical protein FH972_023971 [Carpinus fangiana]|uniref:Isochorismatase-like domain-containing protein n=1 Tax=Carpinus fangiana TaxID=176857 RepID=A0A5N6KXD3_9ROSI|nr:hypothetical protein FH972_023971 [Carpinus fangiana]
MQRCREEAIQIAFLNWVIDEHDLVVMPPGVQRAFYQRRAKTHGSPWFTALGAQLPGDMGRCLWRDSWNAALYAPLKEAQQPEDVIFHKNRPSGMWSLDQDMHRYLRQHDKKTVIFAGVNTDQCVLGTLTDAYSNGFDCILLGDCTGTQSGFQANELCDWNVATMYGFVTDSASFVSSVRETD